MVFTKDTHLRYKNW